MAISQKRYVDITSGVAAQPQATRREFILRCMTTSSKQPSAEVSEFSTLADVAEQFGITSAEYVYAGKYFAFTSKDVTKPGKISFGRYADSNIAASIIGMNSPAAVADIKTQSTVTFTLKVNGANSAISADCSSVASYADVASALQTAIRADSNTALADATVGYVNSVFTITGGSGVSTLSVSGGEIAMLGLDKTIDNAKVDAETPAEAMARTAGYSDNFGSFLFVPVLTTSQITAVAEWNNTDEQNLKYIYCVPVTNSTYSELTSALDGFNGVWVQLATAEGKEEYMPAAWLAAIDFTRTNGTSNPMFQQFPGAAVAVSNNTDANTYDAAKVNYYGATQTAGRQLAFLQRGVLQGNIADAGVYANEMWMKDSFTTAFLNLLLAINKIPANRDGEAMCRTVMQETIDIAKRNGTILPAKEFDAAQKAGINALCGRTTAANEVYADGYAISITVTTDPNDPATRIIKYLLVYSKGDSIRKVVGTDVMV